LRKEGERMKMFLSFKKVLVITLGAALLVFASCSEVYASERSEEESIFIPVLSLSRYVPSNYFAEYIFDEENGKAVSFKFRRWRRMRRIVYVQVQVSKEESKTVSFRLPPNDPYYKYQWGLQKINAEKAWNISTGKGIVVAVLDTGIDYTHPDISSKLWYNRQEVPNDGIDNDGNGFVDDYLGWDFAGSRWYRSTQDNDVIDRNGHGTHVSGIIAAEANNSEGIVGVSPDAYILPVKVLDDSGRGSWSSVARGIRYAADMGAKIINLSLGGWGYASPRSFFGQAVKYAANKGCVIVAAAGNSNSNVNNFMPANMSDVIAVGATTGLNDKRAYFSNYGSCLDVAAPGVNILSLRSEGTGGDKGYDFFPRLDQEAEYRKLNGTSMAAPFVSGLAALLLAKDPTLTPNDVRRIIRFSSEDLGSLGFDEYFGYGRIDAYAALTYKDSGENKNEGGDSSKTSGLSSTSEKADKKIKGADIDEVVSMYEARRQNRRTFTGYSPKERIPDKITLE
jgi:type VII secretion-associated serine protease mycosin